MHVELRWPVLYALGGIVALLALRHPPEAVYNGASLLFFLVFLTELNDVAQYVWGKLLGRRQVLPRVSPKKTREGLLGGVATTVLVAGSSRRGSRRWQAASASWRAC